MNERDRFNKGGDLRNYCHMYWWKPQTKTLLKIGQYRQYFTNPTKSTTSCFLHSASENEQKTDVRLNTVIPERKDLHSGTITDKPVAFPAVAEIDVVWFQHFVVCPQDFTDTVRKLSSSGLRTGKLTRQRWCI